MKKIIMWGLETHKTTIVGIHLGKLVVAEYTSAYETRKYDIHFGQKQLTAEVCGHWSSPEFRLAEGVFDEFEKLVNEPDAIIKRAPKGFTIEGYYDYMIECAKDKALDPDSYNG